MSDSYHPLPWQVLRYDTNVGGYVVNLSKEKLERAPSYVQGDEPDWGDRNYNNKIYAYYDAHPFWLS